MALVAISSGPTIESVSTRLPALSSLDRCLVRARPFPSASGSRFDRKGSAECHAEMTAWLVKRPSPAGRLATRQIGRNQSGQDHAMQLDR
jgi:hypothetical protein